MTAKKRDLFTILALAYLALPSVLFLATWINPFVGIPVICALLWAIASVSTSGDQPLDRRIDHRSMWLVVATGVLWTVLSGVGGLVPQSEDYLKHSVIFHDLVHLPWPVVYHRDTPECAYLCYGVGYYLVPAALARFLGSASLNALSFLWACAGICLFFYWVATFNPRAPARTLWIFIAFSSFGIAWYAFKEGRLEYFKQLGIEHSYLDHWAKLFYTPQHGIAGWLGAAVIYDLGWVRKQPASAFLAWACLLLWSPFVCIGLLPILAICALRVPVKRWFALAPLAGGLLLVAVMGIYFSAHQPLEDKQTIWRLAGGRPWFLYFLLFVFLEVLIPAGCVLYFDYKHRVLNEWRPIFFCAAGTLFLFPLYKMGHESDLRLQGSGGLLVFMALGFAACLLSPKFSLRSKEGFLLFAFFAINTVYPLGRPLRNLRGPRDDYRFETIQRTMDVHDMSEIGKSEKALSFDFARQYLGRNDSFAYRWMLRR